VKSSLYFHIPYCSRKCSYCDFTSFDQPEISPDDYTYLLFAELSLRSRLLETTTVPTLYFGGGTPSLFTPLQISSLLEKVDKLFSLEADAEITLEANPGTVTRESLEGYRAAGVNRLSLGVQSLDDRHLALLGRIHSAAEAREAFTLARSAGFRNIGIDLMHSLPQQSLASWQTTLREAAALQPEHISVYGLSVEAGTPFAQKAARGELDLPDEELAVAMFELTAEYLTSCGYQQYEISNYALPGYRSRHNQVYWRRGNYLGFGAGAHSFLNSPGYGGRWENPLTLKEYAAVINSGNLPEIGVALTRQEAMAEFMFLGLRLLEGIDSEEFARQIGLDLEEAFPQVVARLCAQGLLAKEGTRLRLTAKGLLLANLVMAEFV
jgi:oxygen-independent coproporphyrinogen-3 oxidase